MIKKRCARLMAVVMAVILVAGSGCSRGGEAEHQLDPKQPVMITVWNYYNGRTKSAFDDLVSRFNDTVGMEKGIIVESVSHGDVNQLAEETFNAASKRLGADAMPNLFAAYPENAYRIEELGMLVDLNQYFSEEELSAYRTDFLQDCSFGREYGLKIMPVVRSTENLFLNKTDWDKFSGETGADLGSLSTWEGTVETAEAYYEWSGGKALLGIDSLANYIIIASVQTDRNIYKFENNEAEFSFDEELARILWENLYVPYVKGYYANLGKFRSDDEKVGDILMYVGSSAGSAYFPQEVTLSQDKVYNIESAVLPYPCFREGKPWAMVQGAGFAMGKSDTAHEYASAVFLKWLTQEEQNLDFAVDSGYLPVENGALEQVYTRAMESYSQAPEVNPAVGLSAQATQKMLAEYHFYSNPPFSGSYEMRQFYNDYMMTTVNSAHMKVQEETKKGMPPEEAEKLVTDEAHFRIWYEGWLNNMAKIVGS